MKEGLYVVFCKRKASQCCCRKCVASERRKLSREKGFSGGVPQKGAYLKSLSLERRQSRGLPHRSTPIDRKPSIDFSIKRMPLRGFV